MRKTYVEPEIKLIEIEEKDIICTSGCATVCPTYGPPLYGTETWCRYQQMRGGRCIPPALFLVLLGKLRDQNLWKSFFRLYKQSTRSVAIKDIRRVSNTVLQSIIYAFHVRMDNYCIIHLQKGSYWLKNKIENRTCGMHWSTIGSWCRRILMNAGRSTVCAR